MADSGDTGQRGLAAGGSGADRGNKRVSGYRRSKMWIA